MTSFAMVESPCMSRPPATQHGREQDPPHEINSVECGAHGGSPSSCGVDLPDPLPRGWRGRSRARRDGGRHRRRRESSDEMTKVGPLVLMSECWTSALAVPRVPSPKATASSRTTGAPYGQGPRAHWPTAVTRPRGSSGGSNRTTSSSPDDPHSRSMEFAMTTTSPLAAGYVLVGVGTSPAAAASARWAAAEAVRSNAVLYAIHVLPAGHSQDDLAEARRRVATAAVTGWRTCRRCLSWPSGHAGDLAQGWAPTPDGRCRGPRKSEVAATTTTTSRGRGAWRRRRGRRRGACSRSPRTDGQRDRRRTRSGT